MPKEEEKYTIDTVQWKSCKSKIWIVQSLLYIANELHNICKELKKINKKNFRKK